MRQVQFGVLCSETPGPVPITVDPPADMLPPLLQMQKKTNKKDPTKLLGDFFGICWSGSSREVPGRRDNK